MQPALRLTILAALFIPPPVYADTTAVSASGAYRMTVRSTPQTVLPVRETQFFADLIRTNDGAEVTEFTPVSERRNPTTGLVEFIDADRRVVTMGRTVRSHLWMQMGSHGHGAAATQTFAEPRQSNHLVVERAFFTMAGAWQLVFTFRDGDRDFDTITVPVQVARPNF